MPSSAGSDAAPDVDSAPGESACSAQAAVWNDKGVGKNPTCNDASGSHDYGTNEAATNGDVEKGAAKTRVAGVKAPTCENASVEESSGEAGEAADARASHVDESSVLVVGRGVCGLPRIFYRIVLLAVCFWLLFQAYSAAQLLQTAINGTAGYACLASLYALFAFASLFAPFIIAYLQPVRLLAVSAIPYVVFVGVNMDAQVQALVPACLGVGIGAACLWAAQGVYIGETARTYAGLTKEPLTGITTRLNGMFYGIFATAGGISAIIASVIMSTVTSGESIRLLFLYLTVMGSVSVALFSILVPPRRVTARIVSLDAWRCWAPASAAVAPSLKHLASTTSLRSLRAPSPLDMLRFLASDLRMRLFMPLLFMAGMGQGCFNGVWFGNAVAQTLGVRHVGYVGAVYSFASSATTLLIAKLARQPWCGRPGVYVLGGIVHLSFFGTFAVWSAATPMQAGANAGGTGGAWAANMLGAVVFGMGDAIWFSQMPATLQTFFADGPNLACAMASIRFVSSLGFALQMGISVALVAHAWALYMLVAIAVIIALSCIAYLHVRVCSLDGVVRLPSS